MENYLILKVRDGQFVLSTQKGEEILTTTNLHFYQTEEQKEEKKNMITIRLRLDVQLQE